VAGSYRELALRLSQLRISFVSPPTSVLDELADRLEQCSQPLLPTAQWPLLAWARSTSRAVSRPSRLAVGAAVLALAYGGAGITGIDVIASPGGLARVAIGVLP
jgi:hypothetical protein